MSYKCIRCGVETTIGCSHVDCPHKDVWEAAVAGPVENDAEQEQVVKESEHTKVEKKSGWFE